MTKSEDSRPSAQKTELFVGITIVRDVQALGDLRGEQRQRAAVGEEEELARVVALADADLAHGVRHVHDDEVVHRGRRLLGAPAVALAEARDRARPPEFSGFSSTRPPR